MSRTAGGAGRWTALLAAVASAAHPAEGQTVAPAYQPRYRDVRQVELDRNRVARVSQYTLQRDVMEIVLEEGTLTLLTPVDGRTIGAAFTGRGRLRYRPSIQIERDRLRRFEKKEALDEPFTEAVLFFTDSTAVELERSIPFTPGKVPTGLGNRIPGALRYLSDRDEQTLDPDLLAPLLNGESSGYFYAWLLGSGVPWMVVINPAEIESVQLLTEARRRSFLQRPEPVTQHRPLPDTASRQASGTRQPGLFVRQYRVQARLAQAFSGTLSFSADAWLDLASDTTVGPWIALQLYGKLQVDSASWEDNTPATVYKGKESLLLWVNLGRPLAREETRRLHLFYRGDLVDRYGDLFYVTSSVSWYPVPLDHRHPAGFDLTFTYPAHMTLVSVGDRVDSSTAPGRMTQSRWVTPHPIRNASFDIGIFDTYTMEAESLPPVTVLWSDQTHRTIATQRNTVAHRVKDMGREVAQDLAAALEFYRRRYGPAPVSRFYASEIPDGHGEAFPGLINLGYWTFFRNTEAGLDQLFRGHEVAHQWWGISLDFASYRDQWLSEGLAHFSGLWFVESRLGHRGAKVYANTLDRWQNDILLRRNDHTPLWLGYRVATAATWDDYHAIVYEKGAWVIHMLRVLLLDLNTMQEDRFTALMRAFYQRHTGGRASTEDFRTVVEEQTGEPMDWFFDQWVYGSDIPTYKVASRVEQGSDGQYLVRLRIDQERVPPSFRAYIPVAADLGERGVAGARIEVTGARTEVTLPPMPVKPQKIIFNDLQAVLAEVKEVAW